MAIGTGMTMGTGTTSGRLAAARVLVLAVSALALAGCSLVPDLGGGTTDEQESESPKQTSATASDGGGATAAAPSATASSAAPSAPGERCGEQDGWAVVVAQGSVDCTLALAVIDEYESTGDVAPGGRPANPAEVQGWSCEPILYAKQGFEPDTYSSWCQKDGAAVLTIDAALQLPAAGPIRKPQEFMQEGTGRKELHWGFLTPSGSWYCAIVDNPSPEEGLPTGADCFALGGSIPGTDVEQPGGNGPATAVTLDASTGQIQAYYSGDLALAYTWERSPQTLAYGEVLYARGGACVVDQDAGITCAMAGHSFTVSGGHGLSTT